MEDFKLLIEFHLMNERQGPGGFVETKRAIELAGLAGKSGLNVADIGCGTGASAILLAQELDCNVKAVDIFPEFLEALESRAKREDVLNRVTTIAASMDQLPFSGEELDVIWSEGAIYNIGFKNGISLWHKYLKKNGVLAVSEITWSTHSRPQAIQDYWQIAYPEIDTAAGKIKVLEEAGYKLLGYFLLPSYCWTENYYKPIKDRFHLFLEEKNNDPKAIELVEHEKEEIDLFEKYKDYYSYGFYIAQKI